VAGVTAYRTAFGRPRAAIGPQPDTLVGARLWILPNPSGLNAHTSVPLLAEDMRRLREALDDAELCGCCCPPWSLLGVTVDAWPIR
jgi:double-stranded uracil-DNA glycosylase